MSAPVARMEAGEQPAAETLLDALKTIDPAERKKHEAVLDYWLSIRGNRELPPLRDLDPLEISDAAASSALLELIGGGEDAEIKHLGEQLKAKGEFDRISEAPRPSILASIARKLSIVAVSRNFLAFEDEFAADGGKIRCWVTMLPLSSAGAWVDYVYAFVSFGPANDAKAAAEPVNDQAEAVGAAEPVEVEAEAVEAPEPVEMEPETAEVPEPVEIEPEVAEAPEPEVEPEEAAAEIEEAAPPEDVLELDSPVEEVASIEEREEAPAVQEDAPAAKKDAGFSFDGAPGAFYATKAVNVKPTLPDAAFAKEKTTAPAAEAPAPIVEEASAPRAEADAPVEQAAPPEETAKPAAEQKPHKATSATEGSLQSKLTDVRAKADEARMAKLRANAALYEGLSAAYDFALDAEDAPEEYLKIVEGAGLKIQLRSPMRPVVKLAFDGLCDDATITQLEAVLAWAIEQELPRGALGKCIEEAGGIGPILGGMAKAA